MPADTTLSKESLARLTENEPTATISLDSGPALQRLHLRIEER